MKQKQRVLFYYTSRHKACTDFILVKGNDIKESCPPWEQEQVGLSIVNNQEQQDLIFISDSVSTKLIKTCGESNKTRVVWIFDFSKNKLFRKNKKNNIKSQEVVHPGRLTWNLTITQLKRKIIFQTIIFRFHVNLPGCMIFTRIQSQVL